MDVLRYLILLLFASCLTVKDLPLDDCSVISSANFDKCYKENDPGYYYFSNIEPVIDECKHVSEGWTDSTLVFCQSCNTSVYKCFKCGEYIKEKI